MYGIFLVVIGEDDIAAVVRLAFVVQALYDADHNAAHDEQIEVGERHDDNDEQGCSYICSYLSAGKKETNADGVPCARGRGARCRAGVRCCIHAPDWLTISTICSNGRRDV